MKQSRLDVRLTFTYSHTSHNGPMAPKSTIKSESLTMTMLNHQLGRLLEGRYRLDALLGIGSSASVYLAHDTRLDRRVAAKVLHPGLAADAAFVRRFSSEA